MGVEVNPADAIARCLIYSQLFDGDIHVDQRLWAFQKSGDDGASHLSGVLRSLAPTDADVHKKGCAIARRQNADRGEPERGPTRKYYCGHRTAKVSELPLEGEGYKVRLTNEEENGDPAHVDVALYVYADSKSARNTIKANAGMALAEVFGPPIPHVCHEDNGDEQHPLRRMPDCLTAGLSARWTEAFVQIEDQIG